MRDIPEENKTKGSASKAFNKDQVNTICLVHVTRILPKEGVMLARSIKGHNKSSDIDDLIKRQAAILPETRMTLHWSINKVLMQHNHHQLNEGHVYFIIEPLRVFIKRRVLLGGMVEDIIIFGDHRLSGEAIVLVPKEKKSFAVDELGEFKGVVETYSEKECFRERVVALCDKLNQGESFKLMKEERAFLKISFNKMRWLESMSILQLANIRNFNISRLEIAFNRLIGPLRFYAVHGFRDHEIYKTIKENLARATDPGDRHYDIASLKESYGDKGYIDFEGSSHFLPPGMCLFHYCGTAKKLIKQAGSTIPYAIKEMASLYGRGQISEIIFSEYVDVYIEILKSWLKFFSVENESCMRKTEYIPIFFRPDDLQQEIDKLKQEECKIRRGFQLSKEDKKSIERKYSVFSPRDILDLKLEGYRIDETERFFVFVENNQLLRALIWACQWKTGEAQHNAFFLVKVLLDFYHQQLEVEGFSDLCYPSELVDNLNTAFDFAALKGDKETCELLIKHGAKKDMEDVAELILGDPHEISGMSFM